MTTLKVYVVSGYNGLLNYYGIVGVGATLEAAERIKQEHEYMLDKVMISEMEVQS